MDLLYYRKNKNNHLLKHFETMLNLEKIQNYIPIYSKFFTLNETNWNHINLNQNWNIKMIQSNINSNSYHCLIQNETDVIERPIFFKFSPLVDPIKYIIGQYDIEQMNTLPTLFNKEECNEKMFDPNNSGYTDGFFYYLSSKLLNEYNFYHGIDFYGSYLGIKNNYEFNIYDDFDYVKNNTFMNQHYSHLFKFNSELNQLYFRDSKSYKPKLEFNSEPATLVVDSLPSDIILNVNDEHQLCDITDIIDCNPLEDSTDSENSESVSDSDYEERESDYYTESSNDSDSMLSNESEEMVNMTIYKLPVHMIAIEKCKHTLDFILKELTPDEITSSLMQVIMTLLVYQKIFDFTHNDLHTNNIMYVETDEPFLYYCYDNIYYKVPTYGKIYKIIDFGRSIYTFKNIQVVSDSFGPNGDAKTQYNIHPYLNEHKPTILPNKSFDLCRLACSLYNVFEMEDDSDNKTVIEEWCKDHKGRNVLYKNDGNERYPDFKLYKMIARTVHDHTPENQLNRKLFQQYIVSECNHTNLMNIDKYIKIF